MKWREVPSDPRNNLIHSALDSQYNPDFRWIILGTSWIRTKMSVSFCSVLSLINFALLINHLFSLQFIKFVELHLQSINNYYWQTELAAIFIPLTLSIAGLQHVSSHIHTRTQVVVTLRYWSEEYWHTVVVAVDNNSGTRGALREVLISRHDQPLQSETGESLQSHCS